MTLYVGFSIADSMFFESTRLVRKALTLEEVKEKLSGRHVPLVNKSHVSTLEVLEKKFGLVFTIPATPPKATMLPDDQLIVITHDLPRLVDRREYTLEEMEQANIKFGIWTVLS